MTAGLDLARRVFDLPDEHPAMLRLAGEVDAALREARREELRACIAVAVDERRRLKSDPLGSRRTAKRIANGLRDRKPLHFTPEEAR